MAKINLGKKSDHPKFGGGPTDAGLHEAGHGNKTSYPTVYVHDTEPPDGMEAGHAVTLHGKVKKVHKSEESTDEGKKHTGGMEIEVHHMEHHHDAPKKSKDKDDDESVDKGLDEEEKKEKKEY